MSDEIPFQFRMPEAHRLQLSVARKQVNTFLTILWDELNGQIGRLGCLHHYFPTRNSEVYIYQVDWSDISLTFDAQLFFTNHTSKGITGITVAVIDRESKVENIEITKRILELALKAEKTTKNPLKRSPTRLARVPLTSALPINGMYSLQDSVLFPLSEQVHIPDGEPFFVSALEFFVFENSHQEAFREAFAKARDIAAGLCLLTQNLFVADFSSIHFFDINALVNRQEELDRMAKGLFIPDDGLIADQIKPNELGVIYFTDEQSIHKDIIESRDVVIEKTIALPSRSQQALQIILDNISLIQASRRFQEGLIFQAEMIYKPNQKSLGDLLTPYQLIAFVASIEAVLETEPKDVEYTCPSCGDPIIIKERKISKSFRNFVKEYSGENETLERAFKDVYEDRSKFVHTGKDLYNPTAIRPNRPLVLDGKNFFTHKPQYHSNIPDWTGWLLRRYIYRSMIKSVDN